MTKQRTPTRLWDRATKALGKLWAGMITLPEDPRRTANQKLWTDFPRFPPF